MIKWKWLVKFIFGEIHALISDYAKVTVQSSVSCCDFLFISIVSVQWSKVGRPAWCHIFNEKMFRLFHTYSIYSSIFNDQWITFFDNSICVDIDECSVGNHKCNKHAKCLNILGPIFHIWILCLSLIVWLMDNGLKLRGIDVSYKEIYDRWV